MSDPNPFWLTVMNIALGAIVVVLLFGVVSGVLCEFVAKLRNRRAAYRELDHDLDEMFHSRAPKR